MADHAGFYAEFLLSQGYELMSTARGRLGHWFPRRFSAGAQIRSTSLAFRISCVVIMSMLVIGCAAREPTDFQAKWLQFEEMVRRTTEERLLLDIVQLRYADAPGSPVVLALAGQFEMTQNVQSARFLAGSGMEVGPMPLDLVISLAKTTRSIATVFRLCLETLNGVPNAPTARSRTPKGVPVFQEFQRGVSALQALQDRGQVVSRIEARRQVQGSPLPVGGVIARDIVEAAERGYEYSLDEAGTSWTLLKKIPQPVFLIDPQAVESVEMREVARVFRLKSDVTKFAITEEGQIPVPAPFSDEGVTGITLRIRSFLQMVAYVAHGVHVPAEHVAAGLVTVTRNASGQTFDRRLVTDGFFRVHSIKNDERPPNAHVAVPYRGYWFYIDERDQDTKATFSLMMDLFRLQATAPPRPAL
jgi:hypothetical protein